MGEWRWLRSWSEEEIAARLAALGDARSTGADTERAPREGYGHAFSEAVVAREPSGPPQLGGAFERARELVTLYAFSDPAIVTAHFDRSDPLLGRRMLLELRAVGLRFLGGTVVGAVRDEHDAARSLFGYRYDTLEGHIEAGSEWFLVTKDHATGEVRFRIEALWSEGQLPNAWSRLGFRMVGRRYQRAWHRLAYARLRALLDAEELPPLPAHARIIHQGPRLGIAEIERVLGTAPAPEIEIEDESEGEVPIMKTTTVLLGAAGLGAVAGMRALLAPALASAELSRRRLRRGDPLRRALASRRTARALRWLAASEVLADKTPFVPARVEPISLVGRAASGALVGAVMTRDRRLRWIAAGLGALSAIATAHAAYRARSRIASCPGARNVVAGLAEDGVALAAGRWLATLAA